MFFRHNTTNQSIKHNNSDKYHRIVFQFDHNLYKPIWYSCIQNPTQQNQQITIDHPDYFKIFPKLSKEIKTQEYITKENDSLAGIALELNINEHLLKKLNQFSIENIFPGMKIQIPEDIDPIILKQNFKKSKSAVDITTTMYFRPSTQSQIFKYEVYFYAGDSNLIKGIFTIKSNYILFNPSIQEKENKSLSMQQLLKYNFIIDVADIKQVWPLISPQDIQYDEIGPDYNVFRIYLLSVGQKEFSLKQLQKINEFKKSQKAIASITFKIYTQDEKKNLMIKHEIVQKISNMILKVKYQQKNQMIGLTTVPYFDLLIDDNQGYKSFHESNKDSFHSTSSLRNKIKLLDQSMLPHQSFLKIWQNIKGTNKLHNWKKIYQAMYDGTSQNNFLRVLKNQYPLILMIKQYNGNIFGAYIVQQLEKGKSGRGEMFIWKYQVKEQQTYIYNWTHKNNFFCYLDKDGLGIGMGKRYGIFIKNTLQKGHSGATDTFGNSESLSVNQQFQIEDIELWTLYDEQI